LFVLSSVDVLLLFEREKGEGGDLTKERNKRRR